MDSATMADNSAERGRLSGKALITGASGFIGGRLRDRLLDDGLDVVCVRRPGSPAAKRGRAVEARYDDAQGLTRIMADEKPDYVLHVAGATDGVTYADYERANVMPTKNLAMAARENPALRRFVLVSSLAAFGPSTATRPLSEDDPARPVEHYGRSKLAGERALAEVAKDEVPYVIVRPAGVYGPGDANYFKLFSSIEKRVNIYFGNRDRWFSGVYVDDCIDAILLATASDRSVGQGYFVSDGEPVTWTTFQEEIIRASGRRVLTLDFPERLVDLVGWGGELVSKIDNKPRLLNRQRAIMAAQEAWTCTIDKAREELGYEPTVKLRQGIEETLAWYRRNRWV